MKTNQNFEITIGSDPEFFLRHKASGQIVSAIPVVKFDKDNRIDLGGGHNFYFDNVSVEGNVSPAFSKKEFVGNIEGLISKIEKYLKGEYEAVPLASHKFSEDQLQDDEAQVIGCNPFYLSHSMTQAMPPEFSDGIRASGFHIHIGRTDWEKFYQKRGCKEFLINGYSKAHVINMMDLFVGVPSIVFDNGEDSRFRKSLYTQSAGAHRPTPYGVEYRPLSASCMRSSKLIGLIYDLTEMAINASLNGDKFDHIPEEQVVECINSCNTGLAREIMGQVLSPDYIEKVESFSNI